MRFVLTNDINFIHYDLQTSSEWWLLVEQLSNPFGSPVHPHLPFKSPSAMAAAMR